MCSVLLKCNLTLTHTLLEVSTLIIGVIVTMVTRHSVSKLTILYQIQPVVIR